jgi:radical SAM superfamily enzyme YgiQ (UPF0313 family)
MKKRIIFRRYPFNTLTIPLLLNIFENSALTAWAEAEVWDAPSTLVPGDIFVFSLMTPFLPVVADEIAAIGKGGGVVIVGGPHLAQDNHELLLEMGAAATSAAPAEASLIPMLQACMDGSIRQTPFWPHQPLTVEDFSAHLPVSSKVATLPPLELMRGCGYACAYCATSGHRRVMRTWPSVVKYLDLLHQRKAVRVNFIVPSALDLVLGDFSPGESLAALFAACSERSIPTIEYGIFPSEIRPETVDDGMVALIRDHVCNRSLTLGLQSGSATRLSEIGRKCDLGRFKGAVDIIIAAGLGVNMDLIVGFPDEDVKEMSHSLQEALELKKRGRIKVQVHRFFPLGNSAWQWRRPSVIDAEKRALLDRLERAGQIRAGWRLNDLQWQQYWNWLCHDHPSWAKRYG